MHLSAGKLFAAQSGWTFKKRSGLLNTLGKMNMFEPKFWKVWFRICSSLQISKQELVPLLDVHSFGITV